MLRRFDTLRGTRRTFLLESARLAAGGTLASALAASAFQMAAAQATPSVLNLSAYPEVKITQTDQAVQLSPATISSGYVLLTVTNKMTGANATGGSSVVGPPAGMSLAELQAQAKATPVGGGLPPVAYQATVLGGPGNIDPGQTGQAIIHLPAGQWAVTGGGNQPFATLTATPGTPGATSAPKAAVTITEVDFAFGGLDVPIAAGKQIWQVVHQGTQPHMLVLLQLPVGATISQIMQLLSLPNNATPSPGMLNPAQIQDRGGVDLQSKGTTVWPVVDLPAGHYGALCFVGDPTKGGEPHAMEGMIALFDVK